jgi:hypothetical protein
MSHPLQLNSIPAPTLRDGARRTVLAMSMRFSYAPVEDDTAVLRQDIGL